MAPGDPGMAGRPKPSRLAIVPPRFGPGVVGGSEAVSREIALGLSGRGWDVEVLTTCATDHYTWNNDLPEGATDEDGLLVRRFPTVHHHSRPAQQAQVAIQEGRPVSMELQVSWLSGLFTVPRLFHYLLKHVDRYRAMIFSPYLFWTTTACMPPVAQRAVVIPCLHDESYARLDVVRPVLDRPAQVWFLSEPEHQVAHRLGPVAQPHPVIGAGVDPPGSYDPDGFMRRHGLTRPFVLFAGRREHDKGWGSLMEMFGRAVGSGLDLDLVSIGVGRVEVPPGLIGRVIDLGFVEESERDNAMAAACAYVQPSRMESFSRSVMEAWLAGTPVVATSGSEVVAWHLERSGGGLTFKDSDQLAHALHLIHSDPAAAAAMAESGRRYVLEHYSWPAVLDRIEAQLAQFAELAPLA